MTIFAADLQIMLQHDILGYKLAIEVDVPGHIDRDIDYEIERQKAMKKELDCKFIGINPAKKDFNIFC